MKAWQMKVRLFAPLFAICSCMAVMGGTALADLIAPTVTVSPTHVSLGVPAVGSPSPEQTVSVIVTGGNPGQFITVNSVSVAAITQVEDQPADFVLTSDHCTGVKIVTPGVCSVGITFTPQTTGLRKATLNFGYTSGDNSSLVQQVPMNGAAGAIKLFDSMLVEQSAPGTPGPLPPGKVVKSNPLNLVCPANAPNGIFASLSSLPDATGNVFEDNFIQVTPQNADGGTNVCTGAPSGGDNSFNSCFQVAYESVAPSFVGDDPDTTPVGDGTFTGTYGVAPIDVHGLLVPGAQTVEFDLVDVGLPPTQSGALLGASTLHLVTNCTASSVTTGGTIQGNPINPNNPASLIQDFPFNTTQGSHIDFSANFVNATTFDMNGAVTPNLSDTGILQTAFPPMVTGTSVAPAICIRLNGERSTDGNNTPLCKAFTITCTDPVTGLASGANCPQGSALAAANKLFFETKIDIPASDSPIVIAPGTGPGLLEGTDDWATTLAPCGTGTPALFPAGDGPESGQLCPENPLTEFRGAGDPTSGSNPRGVNSTFIPVLNVPLPLTTVTTTPPPFNGTGWVSAPTGNVTINFSSSPATYTGPNPNGFTPAPIASFTYGTETPVPDPTTGTNGDPTFTNGSCPSSTTSNPFNNSATINFGGDGIFNNVHYFATDCAGTEELLVTSSIDPNKNWASFKTVTVKIDSVPPTISAITFSPASTGNIFASGQVVHVNFTCADALSGLAAPCTGTGGVLGGGVISTSSTGTKTFTVTATDNAGNQTTSTVNYQVVGSSELAILNLTKLTVNAGNSLVFTFGVIDLGPAVADNIVFKTTLPAGVTFSTAGFGTVSCTMGGCPDIPAPPSSCSFSGGVVTCNIPTVGLITKLTGVLVKITVSVPPGATPGTIVKDTATVKAANTDPISFDNTATTITEICSRAGVCPRR